MNGKKFRTRSTMKNYGWEISLGRQQELSHRGAYNARCQGLWAPSGRQWRASERSWVVSLLTQIVIISHVVFLMHAFWTGTCFWMKSHLTFAYYRCHLFFPQWVPFTVMIGPNVAWKNCHCTGGDLFQSVSHSLFLLEMWIFMLWTFHDAIKTLIVIIYRC